jgi:type IV secretion system protein VirB8
VARLAPLKSVEPYLIQIDEKTGITQRVTPVTRDRYAADPAVDRYFTTLYLRTRESYNISVLRQNYNTARLMSTAPVFRKYRQQIDPNTEGSMAQKLGAYGQRDVKIRSMAYITDPSAEKAKKAPSASKIIQARITTTELAPNQGETEKYWIVTVTFEYADLSLNEADQLLNPLGYTVTSYQIQPEVE